MRPSSHHGSRVFLVRVIPRTNATTTPLGGHALRPFASVYTCFRFESSRAARGRDSFREAPVRASTSCGVAHDFQASGGSLGAPQRFRCTIRAFGGDVRALDAIPERALGFCGRVVLFLRALGHIISSSAQGRGERIQFPNVEPVRHLNS